MEGWSGCNDPPTGRLYKELANHVGTRQARSRDGSCESANGTTRIIRREDIDTGTFIPTGSGPFRQKQQRRVQTYVEAPPTNHICTRSGGDQWYELLRKHLAGAMTPNDSNPSCALDSIQKCGRNCCAPRPRRLSIGRISQASSLEVSVVASLKILQTRRNPLSHVLRRAMDGDNNISLRRVA
jgi:hypothetical protein